MGMPKIEVKPARRPLPLREKIAVVMRPDIDWNKPTRLDVKERILKRADRLIAAFPSLSQD